MPSDASLLRTSSNLTLPTAVPELAAKVGHAHGLGTVATLGWPGWSPADVYPALSRLDLGVSWPPAGSSGDDFPSAHWDDTVLVAEVGPPQVDQRLVELVHRVPLAILQVTADAAESVRNALGDAGIEPTFLGQAHSREGQHVGVLVVDRQIGASPTRAPARFRVLAVITAFNESDLLEATVESLHRDEVEVHLIDNWSTDGTYEIAARLADAGVITLERFPPEPPTRFDHGALLRKIESVAEQTSADWVIHHDMDERRRPPWEGVTLRDSVFAVDRSGFSAVNHTVLTFRPVDDSWTPGVEPESHLRYFELEARPDLLLQIRAWRRSGSVDLATSGGHEARFDGRRLFPYQFLLKHYPLRSQEQGERKIFQERRLRWNLEERAKGWHRHYDGIRVGQSFIWPRDNLVEFVEGLTQRDFLIPFIGGAEVGQSWAAKARLTAIEDDFMRAQTLRMQQRLEGYFGSKIATGIIDAIRRIAWLVRPLRRAIARRRWRRRPDHR